MSNIEHWLLYPLDGKWASGPTVIRDAGMAERARELGRRVEGPFAPADQLAGAVSTLAEVESILRAVDAQYVALSYLRTTAPRTQVLEALALIDAQRGQYDKAAFDEAER
jgi:hypothetical protein